MLGRRRFAWIFVSTGMLLALPSSAEPRPAVRVRMEVAPLPVVAGQPATFTVGLLSPGDRPSVDGVLRLPEAFGAVAGPDSWSGGLTGGAETTLQFTATPWATPQGRASFELDLGDGEVDRAFVVFDPPARPAPRREMHRVLGAALPAPPQPTSGAGGPLELSGRFVYDEDLTDTRGIPLARVRVYDNDGAGHDDEICETTTDMDGYWSCSGSADDPDDDTVEVYARVSAIAAAHGAVLAPGGSTYAAETDPLDMPESGGTADLGSWWPPFNAEEGYWEDGAYHILRMAIYGNELTVQAGGEPLPVFGEPSFAYFVWPDDDADSSSEYTNGAIRIEGPGAADADEWDESVILHEYAHYLTDVLAAWYPPPLEYCNSPGETPPCSHSMNSHENPETAYLEGWADYFPSAVKRFWNLPDPHLYQETTWSFDIEASWHPVGGGWDDVESTVAGILWDLNDGPADDQDADGIGDEADLGHDENHAVFSFYDPPGTPIAPWTIHDFHDGFRLAFPEHDDALRRAYWEHGLDKDTPPDAPLGPTPADGAVDVPPDQLLAWSASDPDGDALTYTVFLEAGDPTPDTPVCQDLPAASCDPGGLGDQPGTFFWYVTARDPFGKETSGATWTFDSCGDADGDGVNCALDCDDADGDTYPGAAEVNDGRDNQCPGDPGYGSIDEITASVVAQDAATFCWQPQSGATAYQVATSGDPLLAADCASSITGAACFDGVLPPPSGQVTFLLVRAASPNAGSWGTDAAGVERAPGGACSAP